MDYEEYLSTWPNPANRVLYPPITTYNRCNPIMKPLELNKHYVKLHEDFTQEYDDLFTQKQASEKKLASLITQLENAEKSVKGVNVWSRKNNISNESIIKRLTTEVDMEKKNDDGLQEKMDALIKSNTNIINIVSIHTSRMKAYDEYVSWKIKTTKEINDALS